jgi:signal transduction histidine kinase/DNA-binding response OmpR family regulator
MSPLRFLLLEDSLLDAELVQVALAEGEIECEVQQVDTRSSFIQALESDRFDLILSDYALPGFDGISALAVAQSVRPEVPFIIVSGTLGEELAIETLKSGATDYILKQRLGRLVPSVKRALREAQARRDRQQAETALQESENRLRFLAEASVILTASLDYKTTLENIAGLTVPFLADFCFFDVVTSDGNIQRAAWSYCDRTRPHWFDQIQSFVPSQSFTNHPTRQVIATGKSALMAVVTDEWMQAIATRDEHLEFMRELRFQSEIAVPLVIHDRRLGVLTCGFTAESGRHYTETDLHLVEELANRAAIALDNAQLYQQAQEANRVKDEFLAVLSHELRTPLNPILGWSKLLKVKLHDRTTLMRGLETIERNAQIQTQLIEDLLDVSRILSGKLNLKRHSVSLIPIIQSALETVRLSAEAKVIDLIFSLPDTSETFSPQTFQIIGDAGRLQQIFWNLFSNAIKFTPANGRVQVQITVAQNTISSSCPQGIAQIKITDTGKGIPADFLPYVFDYFRQADGSTTRTFGGLGIGLAIVRHLVELHGGTVLADSPGEEQGSTFTVKLPLKETAINLQIPPVVANPPPSSLPLSGLQILLVDDEKDTLDLMTFLLEESGAIVTPVSSVQAALSALERVNHSLLISDIGMPSQDGYSLIKQLRSRRADLPAIAITAYAREEDRQQVIAAGFQTYLTKPIEPEAVITAITTLNIPTISNVDR